MQHDLGRLEYFCNVDSFTGEKKIDSFGTTHANVLLYNQVSCRVEIVKLFKSFVQN